MEIAIPISTTLSFIILNVRLKFYLKNRIFKIAQDHLILI